MQKDKDKLPPNILSWKIWALHGHENKMVPPHEALYTGGSQQWH